MQREMAEGELWSARVLAAELRLPFTVAAQSMQLARIMGDISLIEKAEKSLRFSLDVMDQFIATSSLSPDQLALELESYTIGATLDDVAHSISPVAKAYGVELVVHFPRTQQPATMHRLWTATLLANLATVFIHMPVKRLTLGGHRTSKGVRAGVFADGVGAAEVLRSCRLLAGNSAQPARFALAGSANLIIADRIGRALRLPISASIHARQPGIALTLPWSQQLRLV